ncbi:hypothetical protein AALP_AAs58859U000300 [Arabis alpina]|uniref:Protein ENHANCED DISEASE RESISTANCE 2 C-terminal domain-containing protein n=1 Tax=Arabis alpina TaxID=50452 RepID=A0A087G0R3_ARAAL|nr:hypothetical protein AALP_AAs58859U000300 [Arabis alpina]
MNQTEIPTGNNNSKPAKTGSISTVPAWIAETINGGSFPVVDPITGSNGWATPPGDVFPLRSVDYFKNKQKSPGGDYLLSPAGVDWLKSTTKLDNVLARPDNRVAHALRQAQSRGESLNNFIFAVNFQIPTKEPYSMVLYYATEYPIPSDSLLYRLINEEEDDSFRNHRFKLVSHVQKGPWVVKAAAGRFGALVLGKNVRCSYHRGSNYFEIDVDLSTSAILSATVRLVLGYAMSVTLDVGFVVEAQTDDELPEKLIGAVRLCQMDLVSVFTVVVDDHKTLQPCRVMGSEKGKQHDDDNVKV